MVGSFDYPHVADRGVDSSSDMVETVLGLLSLLMSLSIVEHRERSGSSSKNGRRALADTVRISIDSTYKSVFPLYVAAGIGSAIHVNGRL